MATFEPVGPPYCATWNTPLGEIRAWITFCHGNERKNGSTDWMAPASSVRTSAIKPRTYSMSSTEPS